MDKRTDINTASFAYSVSLLRIRISGYPPGAGTKRQSIHTAVLHGIAVFFCSTFFTTFHHNKAEEMIIEYNEELKVWKNQTEQKKEKSLEQTKKASVLEKLHRYQQEGRQQPKRSVKKKSMDRER